MASVGSLARVAAIGGVVVLSSGFYFKFRIQNNIKQSEYFKESLKIVRSNRGVAHLMGEPIRDGTLDLGDSANNFCTGKEAQFQVPVKGPKLDGTLYLFASRPDYGQQWNVDRLELGLKDDPSRRILLHVSDQQTVSE